MSPSSTTIPTQLPEKALPLRIADGVCLQLSAWAVLGFLALIRFYRLALSPLSPPACRYQPTCSAYAEEVFRRHGLGWGLALTLARLARCHPFATGGAYDPAPETPSLRALLGAEAVARAARTPDHSA